MIRQEFVENLILLLIMGANFGCIENSFMQKHENFNMWLHLIHCFTLSKIFKKIRIDRKAYESHILSIFLKFEIPKTPPKLTITIKSYICLVGLILTNSTFSST